MMDTDFIIDQFRLEDDNKQIDLDYSSSEEKKEEIANTEI